MTKKHLKHLLVFTVTLLIGTNGQAQTTIEKALLLTDFLLELETEYAVKFSFADDDLVNLKIDRPVYKTLASALEEIQNKTNLSITQLNERYYGLTKTEGITICGFVLDNFKNNTIPGATVEILDSNTASATDAEGKFRFENVPANTLILIQHLGFKPQFLKASEFGNTQNCKTIAMALSYQELDEVVVSKFLTTGVTKLTDGSIELSPSKFGILPGISEPDVLQTVQALPGIKSVDETVSDINIRGGTNDQNLILWDGIKMYQTGHFFGLISAFNPYVTHNVNVIKNGTSALYGDGISGTLDMETSNTLTPNFKGGAGFNLISGDIFGAIPIKDDVGIQVSARRSHTDLLNTPTYTVFSEKAFQDTQVDSESEFYFYDFTAKLLYDINPYQKLRVSSIHMSNNLNYLEAADESTVANQSNLNQNNISLGAQLQSSWTDDLSSEILVYYTQYGLEALTVSNNGAQNLEQDNLVKESSVKLVTTYTLTANLEWGNGYEFMETGIENRTNIDQPPFSSNIKGVVRKHALFSEIRYASDDDKFYGILGGRLNYIENVNTFKEYIFEPRLNLSYELLPYFKTEVLGEFKSQAINQIIDLEQNFLGIEKRRWILSDENTLPITTSKQGSIGINYDANTLYIGIDGFYKAVDGINIRTQGFQNENQFNSEIGRYAVKGLEFLINKKNNRYSTWLSYTYNINDYTFEELVPTSFPNNLDIRHAVTLAATYTQGSFKFGCGLNYQSGKPYTQPDQNDPVDETVFPNQLNFRNANSSRLPAYFRADASAIYDFELGENLKATLGASVLNLTNRKNTLNTYYRLREDSSIEQIERVSLGITPNVSFRIQF